MSVGEVAINVFGGASGTAFACRHRGETRLVVVIKVQVALAHEGLATIVPGAEIWRGESHFERNPERSLELPSDLVPLLPKPEILLHGHAFAPRGTTASALSVRLFVGGDAPVLDKTVHVYGDRPGGQRVPTPFARMPLVYDRAIGGPGTDNPVGRDPRHPAGGPNVVDPAAPWRATGFGPLAASWPPRMRLLGPGGPPRFRDGVLDVPDDLPLAWFQTAPPDQQVDEVPADAWIVADAMHPTLPRFESQLPGLVPRARLTGPAWTTTTAPGLSPTLDRLVIDMDRWAAWLCYRASVALPLELLRLTQVVAGVEDPQAADELEASSQTVMLDSSELDLAAGRTPLPWAPAAKRSSPGKALGGLPFGQQPPAAPALPRAALDFASEETVTGLTVHPAARSASPLPFQAVRAGTSSSAPPPFGRPPAPVGLPRLGPLDDEEDADSTAVAPIPEGAPSDALPFSSRTQQAPGAPPSGRVEPPLAEHEVAPPASTTQPAFVPEPVAAPPAPALVEPAPVTTSPPMVPALVAAPTVVAPEPASTGVAPTPASAVASSEVRSPSSAPSEPPRSVAPGAPTTLREQVEARVAAREGLASLDLEGADLSGMDLRGANCSGADLSGAKLASARLVGARFGGAKLVGADLAGADLSEADLSGADLTRAVLREADLSDATLSDATLSMVGAERARFDRARAERARLDRCRLDGAQLRGAMLRLADLSGASLGGADFEGANLEEARLSDAQGTGARFVGANLADSHATGASLPEVDLSDASAERSNWERARLDASRLVRARLGKVSLARASALGARFDGADLSDANLVALSADGADFSNATLDRADLRQARLGAAVFEGASLRGANVQKVTAVAAKLEGACLAQASFRSARLRGAVLKGADLDGADLRDADLEGADLRGTDRTRAKLAGATLRGLVDDDG